MARDSRPAAGHSLLDDDVKNTKKIIQAFVAYFEEERNVPTQVPEDKTHKVADQPH